MRCITTPILCLLLGLLMAFVLLADVSGAAADDDDDDNRRSSRYSEWRQHDHYHGHGHHHGHRHRDDDDWEYDDDDDRHEGGDRHWHHRRQETRRDSGWFYLEEDEILEIEPSGPVVWRNPDVTIPADPPPQAIERAAETGNTDANNAGRYSTGPCREYHTKARIGGRLQQIYGRACRQPDGSWKFLR